MFSSLLRLCCAFLCLFTLAFAQVAAVGAEAPYKSDPRFVAAMADAKKETLQRRPDRAVEALRKANNVAGGRCGDCYVQIAKLDIELRDFKGAVKSAEDLRGLVTRPVDISIAEILRGEALYAQGGEHPKAVQLEAAHEAFQAALAAYPKSVQARYMDGEVLARQGQMDAARAQFAACLDDASPDDPAYLRAKRFAARPELSFAKMAPAFTVTALDGSRFTLDAMDGRVVLIDFWATWCGPCNEELPQLKKIARDFAGQPLVIISVSWDDDDAKWRSFIQKNEMTWVQYRDADHQLAKRFAINEIPHYFTIDSDGVLTAEMMGSGNDVEGKLKKMVAKAKARGSVQALNAAP